MALSRLRIDNLRNLSHVDLLLDPRFNILVGPNGSGKTSTLEAIYFLSHARSFRGKNSRLLIKEGHQQFRVVGSGEQQNRSLQIGVEKSTRDFRAKINGESIRQASELSSVLPCIVIYPETFSLLVGDPAKRRAFLDWGLFYQYENFSKIWAKYQRALKQRNAAIKQGAAKRHIALWNKEIAEAGQSISERREGYLKELSKQLEAMPTPFKITIKFKKGWDSHKDLLSQLEMQIERDLRLGYTYSGPHRDDFSLISNDKNLAGFASRGQLKLVTFLLKLAQLSLFKNYSNKDLILLVDDIASELDSNNLNYVLNEVRKLGVQTILTGLEGDLPDEDLTVFHVEQGSIVKVL